MKDGGLRSHSDDLPLFAGLEALLEPVEAAPKPRTKAPAAPKQKEAASAAPAALESKPAAPAPQPQPPTQAEPQKAWSVSELTTRIRGTLEPAFTQVWVQGEVSNCRPATSGHLYFSLKDAQAQIAAACFGWGARRSKPGVPAFEMRDGLSVLCRGKLTLYPPRGSYQLTVDQIEPLGAGALQVAYEQLKGKLAAEGLFDPSRKRKLPPFPTRIAVVTSPGGAAIQDMLNILKRRSPQMRVVVIPALVQGPEAPAQILRGLELANRHALGEVIVLARGGGSIEDLWGFNDEKLARAIAQSALPVISAVGHEIDFTIADFVADLRAPTPSAAAEIVSGGWVDVARRVQDASGRLRQCISRDLRERRALVQNVAARVVNPRDRLREQMQRLDEWVLRLENGWARKLERAKAALSQNSAQLNALSPLQVLERGYTLARTAEGVVLTSASQVHSGSEIHLKFRDGERRVVAQAVQTPSA